MQRPGPVVDTMESDRRGGWPNQAQRGRADSGHRWPHSVLCPLIVVPTLHDPRVSPGSDSLSPSRHPGTVLLLLFVS